MFKPFRERELVRVLSLLGPKVWIYFFAAPDQCCRTWVFFQYGFGLHPNGCHGCRC